MQHALAELVNQHRDQKQPDSEAMFLNFLAKTKSFWSRRLLQCSAWWRCRTSTRWIRKAWDTSNPFVDFFWIVAALEASKFLSDLANVCVFQDDPTKPTSRIDKRSQSFKTFSKFKTDEKQVDLLKCIFNWAPMKLVSKHTITDDSALLVWENRCPMCF